MPRALIVSAGNNANEYLARHMADLGYIRPAMAASGGEARRQMDAKDFEVIVINAPLPDEFGTRLAQDICQHSAAGVAKKSVHSLLAQDLYKDLRTIQLHGVAPIPVPLLIHSLRESF